MRPTRRGLLVGGAAVVFGCAGGRDARGRPAPEPGGGAAPPAPAAPLFRVDPTVERPTVRWVEAPAWFRDAPGLWCPSPVTAGSVLLTFAPRDHHAEVLCGRLSSFRDLPALLRGARAQGTDVLYLTDWYEGRPGAACDDYWWNKSSYEPRADLGGEAALTEGLAAVKAAGGHALLYVEPFVLDKASALGRAKGEGWALKRTDGHPDDPYPTCWKLCPSAPGLQAHFVEIAGRLVGRYGASGLFLDSYGNQRGWRCVDPAHPHPPDDPTAFDRGVRQLVRAVWEEARRHDPQAVVMCEGSKLPLLGQWVAGTLDWGVHALASRWTWREGGHVGAFTAGWSLDDVHQVLALGQRVALGGDHWTTAPTGRCADRVAAVRLGLGHPKDDRMRRYAAESLFQVLHRFRNGALLAGVAAPPVDAVTPRRWDDEARFATAEAWEGLLDAVERAAAGLDALVGGRELPAAAEHLRLRLRARAAFASTLVGAEVEVRPAPGPSAALYRFTGPSGVGWAAVNTADLPVDVDVPGPVTDLVDGGRGPARVPAHDVRFWTAA